MKVLMINGSPRPKGCTFTALSTVAAQLKKNGVETQILQLGTKPIQCCIACGKCKDTGHCVFNADHVNEAIDLLREADGLVVGSPVYYAGPNGGITSFLDRMFFFKSIHYAFKPAAAVVSCRRGGASASFDRLNKYFTIARMPVVSSQYWNAVHGADEGEAMQDIEGVEVIEKLGRNIAWMLKVIDKAGIEPPESRPRTMMNFIR